MEAWSWPTEGPARAALAIAGLLFVASALRHGPRHIESWLAPLGLAHLDRHRRFLVSASLLATFLSLGYIAFYLRGGPRAAAAPTYWLQGRALAHGHLTWLPPGPLPSFRAEGLTTTGEGRLAGIFPPGFPLLLAIGFFVGAPMVVGPALAAAIVVASWRLGRELAAGVGGEDRVEATGRIAVGLSTVCAALRYHTADALPFGAEALAVAIACECALRGRRESRPKAFAGAGLALGALVAIEPSSAAAIGVFVAVLALQTARRGEAATWVVAGAIPGVLALLGARHAVTGHAFASTETAYAALTSAQSAGEKARLAIFSGAWDRLRAHVRDISNFEPFALLPLVVLVGARRVVRARPLIGVVVGQLGVCAFLHPGNVNPAGGAEGLICVLPLEHALLALALTQAFPRAHARAGLCAVAFSAVGFALHASHGHDAFAVGRDGRPRFEPDALATANVTRGLLFFDDDAGYELASDPFVPVERGLVAVRLREDDNDRLTFDWLGHPPAHRYLLPPEGHPFILPWTAPGGGDAWRFDAGSAWPPSAIRGGWSSANEHFVACATGRDVVLSPDAEAEARATFDLPIPRGTVPPPRRTWGVTPRVFERGTLGQGSLELVVPGERSPLARWTWTDRAHGPTCDVDLPTQKVELGGDRRRASLILSGRGAPVALGWVVLRPR
ncbi:MAG: hypothetical protein ABSC94_06015 [Polyangiaceae bacterium]|jgi:hypothetical protein